MVKQEFRSGDIVKLAFCGDREFELLSCGLPTYPVKISTGDFESVFTRYGKYRTSHTHPALTLIRRPSDMIKKEIVLVGFVVKGGVFMELVKDSDDYNHTILNPGFNTKVSERTIEINRDQLNI